MRAQVDTELAHHLDRIRIDERGFATRALDRHALAEQPPGEPLRHLATGRIGHTQEQDTLAFVALPPWRSGARTAHAGAPGAAIAQRPRAGAPRSRDVRSGSRSAARALSLDQSRAPPKRSSMVP